MWCYFVACLVFAGVFGCVVGVVWVFCYGPFGPHTTAPHSQDLISIATLCRKRGRYRPSYKHCPLIIALRLHPPRYQAPLIARYPLFTLPHSPALPGVGLMPLFCTSHAPKTLFRQPCLALCCVLCSAVKCACMRTSPESVVSPHSKLNAALLLVFGFGFQFLKQEKYLYLLLLQPLTQPELRRAQSQQQQPNVAQPVSGGPVSPGPLVPQP